MNTSSPENILDFMLTPLPANIRKISDTGDIERLREAMNKMQLSLTKEEKTRILFEIERLKRLRREFPFNVEEAFQLASHELISLSREEFQELLRNGCIDHFRLGDEVRVFRRFIPNMFWLCPELKTRRVRGESELEVIEREVLFKRARSVREVAESTNKFYVLPLRYKVRFTLRVLDREKHGGTLRVWIPIPREDDMNHDVKIIATHPAVKHVAPPDHPQRTLYFELDEGDTVSAVYEFISHGFHVKLDPEKVRITEDEKILSKYTCEKPPHIMFSDYLVRLTESVIGGEKNPLRKALRIWDWITSNVRYAYAMDYSLYDSISEYVARNLRGDCGMQAILFITMARIAGIPARWQSGWYLNPVRAGMHDWAQVHLEPYGWIYVDPSFGNKRKGEDWRNSFYFGSIEGYRLAANIDISTQFDPPKKHFRSDPVDNQQGEVESQEGNLYYDEWESRLEIIEVERIKD